MTTDCAIIPLVNTYRRGAFFIPNAVCLQSAIILDRSPLSAQLRPYVLTPDGKDTGLFIMTRLDGKPCKACNTSDWYDSGGCKKCVKERSTRRAKENPDRHNKNSRRTRANNIERARGYVRRWTEKNLERVKGTSREWSRNNPDRVRENVRRWRTENPEKAIASVHRRRARVKGNGGSYTVQEWRELCSMYDNRCLCCGRNDVQLTVDHVLPVSMGGTSNIDNLQPLCKSCNCQKNDRHIDYRNRGGIDRWIQSGLF